MPENFLMEIQMENMDGGGMDMRISLDIMQRIGRDVSKAAATLGRKEARYLVDTYYMIQEFRKRTANQDKARADSRGGARSGAGVTSIRLSYSIRGCHEIPS